MLRVAGFVEVDASLFGPGVLERGLQEYYKGDSPVIWHGREDEVLGRATKISGRGDRVEIEGVLDEPPPRTVLRDVYKKVASGTIRGLSIVGVFTKDRAEVRAFSLTTVPISGSGLLTKVGE